jgi:hypothetical protein
MKNLTLVRNIPFIDTKGFGFHFQRFNNRIWIEIPFLAFSFKLK